MFIIGLVLQQRDNEHPPVFPFSGRMTSKWLGKQHSCVVFLFNAAAKGHATLAKNALRDNNSHRYYFHRHLVSFPELSCPAVLSTSSVSIDATRVMLHALYINYFSNWSASLNRKTFELHAQQTQPQPQSSPAHTQIAAALSTTADADAVPLQVWIQRQSCFLYLGVS